ncbi:hypothetical protein KDA_08150 [Dictyobacter alpinus]|uniref:Small ribosomal subunit protein bS21 n=1 Tax=Dictyobacter alpinus TaxID=2014873 RepID=A0A402B1V8_9CHLR|nr:hypothetical protein KDA_08150 [Dictyobacter alpinus]
MTCWNAYTIIFAQVHEVEVYNTNTIISTLKTGQERGDLVSEVKIGDREMFETALKRFNRKIQQDGILAEARRREHYEKPSIKRKRKAAARLRKLARKG